MNIWHDLTQNRVTPEKFTVVIEISKGGKNKYELDKDTGMLRLDRVLYTSTHYPANYGFIPKTYADDDDPLDVLVLCQEPILPLTLVDCYPIGILEMLDNNESDEKIIAVPVNDPSYCGFKDISELPTHILDEIQHFFEVYKTLENKHTAIQKIGNRDTAVKSISKAINKYSEKFNN